MGPGKADQGWLTLKKPHHMKAVTVTDSLVYDYSNSIANIQGLSHEYTDGLMTVSSL